MHERAYHVYSAASAYYVQGETMEAIARRLGVSRSTVSRLLHQARDDGVVKISLADPAGPKSSVSATFGRIFGVRAHVVPVREGTGAVQRLDRVARTAGALISDVVDDSFVIGTAWGTTLAAVFDHLNQRDTSETTVVQLNGAMNAHTSGIPYVGGMVQRLADAVNGHIVHFPVPAFFDYPETREAMWRERSVQGVLAVQRSCDLAIFGVGSLQGTLSSHVYSAGYLDAGDMEQLQREGAVGDVCTVLIRADGTWRDISLNSRASGLNPTELQSIPRRFCVAAGVAKAIPLLGALRAHVATDVVVDELTAKTVLGLL